MSEELETADLADHDRDYRLSAEAAAWPLAGRVGFERRLVSIARDENAHPDADADALSDELATRLRAIGRGVSLETVRIIRDMAWFPNEARAACSVSLHDHLAGVARRYIEPRGGRWRLASSADTLDRARRWRWLTLLLPCDLLIAAHCAASKSRPQSTRVSVMSPLLRRVLEQGVAETHLHMGGGYNFSLAWAALMQQLADRVPKLEDRGCELFLFKDRNGSQQMLYAAAIARLVLARHLHRRTEASSPAFDLGREIAGMTYALWDPSGARAQIKEALDLLLCKDRAVKPAELRFLYARLVGPFAKRRSLADVRAADPLAEIYPPGVEDTLSEVCFEADAMSYLRQLQAARRSDDNFARLFWQYCRVRVRLFRYLTLDPGTAGLEWFSQAYARLSPLRGPLEAFQAEAAYELQAEDLKLDALELRTTPEPTRAKMLKVVRSVALLGIGLAKQGKSAEVGLTLHFIKESHAPRPGKSSQPGRYHADPTHAGLRSRYGLWVRQNERRAAAVKASIESHPEILLVLNGLDVAGRELSIPTWPTLVPLRTLQDASAKAAAILAETHPSWGVRQLHLTYHAGEDFRRLTEGLRRIAEVIEYGGMRAGDRIGHGFALFVSPARWAARERRTYQPKDARLEDLLWELELSKKGRDLVMQPGRLPYVEAEAMRLATDIYPNLKHLKFTVDDLIKARAMRHDPRALDAVGYPSMNSEVDWSSSSDLSMTMLNHYLRDRGAFLRGREAIEVATDDAEIEMLTNVQRWLRKQLVEREITIETNPSSNQLITDLESIDHHPAFDESSSGAEDCPQHSVSSDDPLTLATCLADEYAHLYFARLRSGKTTPEALARIEEIRLAGLRSRFTYPASADLRALEQVAGDAARRWSE